ncbi:MAG: CinA family protein [Legionellales bacterium]
MSYTQGLLSLTQQVSTYLRAQKITVCTAESCTGGYLAQMLTTLPGSSDWFDCGFVTYSNSSKQKLLNVPENTILKHGAVSEQVAISMAQGALDQSSADLAIAITGIAGPTGATADKSVGTVWFAWQLRERDAITRCEHFLGDRTAIREQAVAKALGMILQIQ